MSVIIRNHGKPVEADPLEPIDTVAIECTQKNPDLFFRSHVKLKGIKKNGIEFIISIG